MLLQSVLLYALGDPSGEVALLWEAPAACPSGAWVRAKVREYSPRAHRSTAPLGAIDARVTAVPGGYRAHIVGGSAEHPLDRSLFDADCRALADATAFVVAAQIELDAEPAPAASTPPVEPIEPIEPGEPASTEPAIPRWRGGVRLEGGGSFGPLPEIAASAAVTAAARWRGRVQLELGVHAQPRRRTFLSGDAGPGGEFRLTAGRVRACSVLELRRIEPAMCGGLELGVLRAQGRGIEQPRTRRSIWVAPQLGIGLAVPAGRRVAFTLAAETSVPLHRPTFVLDTFGTLYRSLPIGLAVRGGIELRWAARAERRRLRPGVHEEAT